MARAYDYCITSIRYTLGLVGVVALALLDPLAYNISIPSPMRALRQSVHALAFCTRLFIAAPSYSIDLLWRLGFRTRAALVRSVQLDKDFAAAGGLTSPSHMRTFHLVPGVMA